MAAPGSGIDFVHEAITESAQVLTGIGFMIGMVGAAWAAAARVSEAATAPSAMPIRRSIGSPSGRTVGAMPNPADALAQAQCRLRLASVSAAASRALERDARTAPPRQPDRPP